MSPAGPTQPCHRCLQPVPLRAQRCPHCGDFQKNPHRLTLYLGVLGAILVIAVVGFALYLGAPGADPETHTDAAAQHDAPKPVKKPPLD